MPGPPPKSDSLSRTVAFLDSGVAASSSSSSTSTSVDAYLSTYPRALRDFDVFSPSCTRLYRVTPNRGRRLTAPRRRLGSRRGAIANVCSNFRRSFRFPARLSRCKSEGGKRIERFAPVVAIFLLSFIQNSSKYPGALILRRIPWRFHDVL